MTIETSLDWEKESDRLISIISSSGYNPDLVKMLKNIESMVNELSKQEVNARRIKKPENTQALLNQINDAIHRIEQFLLIAQLMR